MTGPVAPLGRFGRSQRRIVEQDLLFESGDLVGGVEADLVGEVRPIRGERAQRLRLTTGLVERHHEVGGESFARWMLSHEALELGDEVVASAGPQVGADAVFDRRRGGVR